MAFGAPLLVPAPQAKDRPITSSSPRRPWGGGTQRGGVAVTAGSAAEAEATEEDWLPATGPGSQGRAASGTGGFGDRRLRDRRLWGAGRLAAGMLRLCRCLVSTNPRAAGGLGPQPLWPQSPRLSAEG